MPEITYHNPAQPDACEVCRHHRRNPEFDARREHTMSWIAQETLLYDLAGATALPMRSIHLETIGYPGPEQKIEPRHWLMALLDTPQVKLSLIP